MYVCMYVMYVCMYACMHACMSVCMYVCINIYIYIYIWFRFAVRQPPPQWYESPGPGPWIQILMLFAAFQSSSLQFACSFHHFNPNPPICALFAPLGSPNFSTYNLYGLFASLETINIYIYIYVQICMYIWFRFADMCVVSAWFSCIQLRLRVVTDAGKSKLHIYSDLFRSIQMFHTQGERWPRQHPTFTVRMGETTPTAGRTTAGDHDHGWGAELET